MSIALRAHLRLLQWLGPWAPPTGAPTAVARESLTIPPGPAGAATDVATPDQAPVEALLYRPTDRAPIGGYLVVHGLNPRGPADPRCDRFARILAHAGFLVMVPRLSAFTELRVDRSAAGELGRALAAFVALPEHPRGVRPGLFSISFGSFPALLTAANPEVGHLVGSVIVFGGYANFVETCRYMMGAAGTAGPMPDPTCMVGLALNVAPHLFAGETAQRLTAAWRAYVDQVWAAPSMKEPARLAATANQLAATLPADLVETFLQGCGVQPGFSARIEAALGRLDADELDPRACLHAVRCPVHLFHGRNDDVIPCTQMHALAKGLTAVRAKIHLTGLYDHSRQDAVSLGLDRLPSLAGEVRTMAGMIHAMVESGMQPAGARDRIVVGGSPAAHDAHGASP
jgi:pimeloyl-ACP methyl ester carboxylesterase